MGNDLDGILPDQNKRKEKFEAFFNKTDTIVSKDLIQASKMEMWRDLKYKVLDDGFVRLVDYMGDDSSIVQAARISYGKGTKKASDDETLIRYLMRHHHTTPFEMCEIKLHIRCPMDVWRQWIRHRTASVNEYSTRYSEAIDSAQKTKSSDWRKQSVTNKQGGDERIDESLGSLLSKYENSFHESARGLYEHRLELGVSREQARKDLPLSTYTEAYWKIDLKNLLDFLASRMDSHAQLEIREYANTIADIVRIWVPMTWRAFEDYRLGAMTLSKTEITCMHTVMNCIGIGWNKDQITESIKESMPNKRERAEFMDKLFKLGLI